MRRPLLQLRRRSPRRKSLRLKRKRKPLSRKLIRSKKRLLLPLQELLEDADVKLLVANLKRYAQPIDSKVQPKGWFKCEVL